MVQIGADVQMVQTGSERTTPELKEKHLVSYAI